MCSHLFLVSSCLVCSYPRYAYCVRPCLVCSSPRYTYCVRARFVYARTSIYFILDSEARTTIHFILDFPFFNSLGGSENLPGYYLVFRVILFLSGLAQRIGLHFLPRKRAGEYRMGNAGENNSPFFLPSVNGILTAT